MDVDLDTFLVTVYTVIDALYRAHLAPLTPPPDGHPTTLSDSEVLTLLIVGQWRGGPGRGGGSGCPPGAWGGRAGARRRPCTRCWTAPPSPSCGPPARSGTASS